MGPCHVDRELVFEIIPVEIIRIFSINTSSERLT